MKLEVLVLLVSITAACAPVPSRSDAGRTDAAVDTGVLPWRFAGGWAMREQIGTPPTNYRLSLFNEREGRVTAYLDDCGRQLSSEVTLSFEPTDAADTFIVHVGPCAPYASMCRDAAVPTCDRLDGVPFVDGAVHSFSLFNDTLNLHSPRVTYSFRRVQ